MYLIYEVGHAILGQGPTKEEAMDNAGESGYVWVDEDDIGRYKQGRSLKGDCVWLYTADTDFDPEGIEEDDLLDLAV